MKFLLDTSGSAYGADKKRDLEELGFSFNRNERYAGTGMEYEKVETVKPEIAISSLENLVDFSRKWGEVVINSEKMALRIMTITSSARFSVLRASLIRQSHG